MKGPGAVKRRKGSLAHCRRGEEFFGSTTNVGIMRKTRYRGQDRDAWMFLFTLAVYNPVRLRNLTWSAA